MDDDHPDRAGELLAHRLPDLTTRLHFNPEQGRIWLDDQRMMLWRAETFVNLRAHLIRQAGMPAARAILIRTGHEAGVRDAHLARRHARGRSAIEAMATGLQMHMLEGMVGGLERLHFAVDETSGAVRGDACWRDSLEATAALADGGIAAEPACWMEVGYVSGYISTFTGVALEAREIECVAMGHAACHIVGRPPAEWPQRAPEQVISLQTPVERRQDAPSGAALWAAPGSKEPERRGSGVPVGASAAFHTALHRIHRAAGTRATVFLQGESGVGKNMFARELHRASERAREPFVEINCAAIPDQLLEAELFGVDRGAFTGATESRAGRFELANRGTLFMDEIGTLSPSSQGKLLRVLQSGELEHLGSTRTIHVDVRVVAATNEDLLRAVREGRFRRDLYYRLNVLPIRIPPLRERRDDIPVLLESFVRRFTLAHDREIAGITARAMRALLAYDWPGNIRELENVIERGVILAERGEPLDLPHLFTFDEAIDSRGLLRLSAMGELESASAGADATSAESVPESAARQSPAERMTALAREMLAAGGARVDDIELALVRAAVEQTGGNVSRAAGLLGMTRGQLDYRLKKLRS